MGRGIEDGESRGRPEDGQRQDIVASSQLLAWNLVRCWKQEPSPASHISILYKPRSLSSAGRCAKCKLDIPSFLAQPHLESLQICDPDVGLRPGLEILKSLLAVDL
jgi:hypothetical protein